MPLLQNDLTEFETSHFSPEEIKQANKVAKRLLGPVKVPAGTCMSVHAVENLRTGDIVIVDVAGGARKWNGADNPNGIVIGSLTKGSYGWIQLLS